MSLPLYHPLRRNIPAGPLREAQMSRCWHPVTIRSLSCMCCEPVKADSHIACRAHAVPLPRRAAKGLECVFLIWFTQCDRVWSTLAMPCHALTMPFFSRPRHSTAVERRPVGYLPAFGFFRLPRGVPRRLLSAAYQSSPQRSIPTTAKSGSSTLQKRRPVKLLEQKFGYFRLPRGLSRRTRHCRSRAGAWSGMCELTARHGHGVLCVNRPLVGHRERWFRKKAATILAYLKTTVEICLEGFL
jgi:hypothetical protein